MKKIKGDVVKWGIIGVGDVCEVKSAPAMQLIEHSELVAVMRRDGEKAKNFAKRHGVAKWYDNAEELLNDPEINAIYVATPPNFHAEYTVEAALAGKPVYVEKPMAKSVEECILMISVCKDLKVPLYVAYYRRRLPQFEKLKSLISEGIIGDVRMVNINLFKTVDPDIVAKTEANELNWRIDPAISGGGYFYDLASHQFDYLDYLFGPIEDVVGMASNQSGLYSAADIIVANYRFENGVIGTGNWCFTVDSVAEKDEMIIIGSEGQISMSFFGEPRLILEKSSKAEPVVFEFELPPHIQQPLIQTVVDDLLGVGECPSLGTTAIRTNRVLEEVTKAFYRDKV